MPTLQYIVSLLRIGALLEDDTGMQDEVEDMYILSSTGVQDDNVTSLTGASPPASPPEQPSTLPPLAASRFQPHLYSISAPNDASVSGAALAGSVSDGSRARVGGSRDELRQPRQAPPLRTSPSFEESIARAILVRSVMVLSRACDKFLELRQDARESAREPARQEVAREEVAWGASWGSSSQLGGRPAAARAFTFSLDKAAWMQLFELVGILSFWRDWAAGRLEMVAVSELAASDLGELQPQTDTAGDVAWRGVHMRTPRPTQDGCAACAVPPWELEAAVARMETGLMGSGGGAASSGRQAPWQRPEEEAALPLSLGKAPGARKEALHDRPRASPPTGGSGASKLESSGQQQAVGEASPDSLVSCLRLCLLWWVGAKSDSRPRRSRCAVGLERVGGLGGLCGG
mgnify:CR=1 FL=1